MTYTICVINKNACGHWKFKGYFDRRLFNSPDNSYIIQNLKCISITVLNNKSLFTNCIYNVHKIVILRRVRVPNRNFLSSGYPVAGTLVSGAGGGEGCASR